MINQLDSHPQVGLSLLPENNSASDISTQCSICTGTKNKIKLFYYEYNWSTYSEPYVPVLIYHCYHLPFLPHLLCRAFLKLL